MKLLRSVIFGGCLFCQFVQEEAISEEDEIPTILGNQQVTQPSNCRMKIGIPQFNGLFVIEDFLHWLAEVKKIFDYWETEEHMKVMLVAYLHKGGVLAW